MLIRRKIAWPVVLTLGLMLTAQRLDLQAQEPAAENIPPPTALSRLVDEALERNPLIQAARRNYDAKKQMELPAATPPDPVLRFETMGDALPWSLQGGDPSSGRIFGVIQEIPFPGKLRLKQRMAADETRSEWWNYERIRRRIASDVKVAYYQLWRLSQDREALRRDKDLLQKMERIANARFQVGEGNQQDLIKAQLEISMILEREAKLVAEEETALAALNALLFRPPGEPLGEIQPPFQAPFAATFDELSSLARRNSPEIRMQRSMIDRSHRAVELARKELYPDFEAGFNYVNRPGMPEMFGWMVGARIPLYFWRKQKPEINGAALAASASEKQYASMESAIDSEIKSLFVEVKTAEKLIDLYGQGIIPQATLTVESAAAGYQAGTVDFLTLLDSLRGLLDSQLKFQETLAERQQALARLEFHTGVEWTR